MKITLLLCGMLWLAGTTSPSLTQAQPAAVSSTATLSLSGPDGQRAALPVAALQTMPRQTIHVHNAHSGTDETYQGVELSTLLARVQAPFGAKLHGKALTMYVVAQGTDTYRAVYSLAEIDPAFHSGTVIVADTLDGRPIGSKEGPLKLVNTEDKRPARWVRNLISLRIATAP